MNEVGATLREARMRAKIDIADVELATKIRAKYLRALENEEWGSLPGPTYVKSFLRTYADYLGLDARLLIDEYKRDNESPSEAELPSIRPGRERERRGPSVSPRAVVIGLVVLAFLGALYGLGAWAGSSGSSGPSAGPAPTGARAHHGRHHPRGAPGGAPRPARTVRLQLVPTGPVYVCLADGAGRTLIPGRTLTPGRPSALFTGARFLVRLGNSAVRLRVNGRTLAVPPHATAVNYLITPAGHRLTARSPRCA